MKKRIRKWFNARKLKKEAKNAIDEVVEAINEVPRITNETVAEHREEVLSSARKYIYPLQQSKHKIVLVSTAIFIVALVSFFSYTTLSLYKFKSYSTFLYGVTQVIPFPIAKAGSNFVAYENYLFELKHYIHYYQNEQKLDFKSNFGKQQLGEFKKRALTKVVNDAYIKQLAAKHKVSISNKEVDEEIQIVRQQNRLGGSDKVFEDVLREYWGWSVDDFKGRLKQQMLAQKLLPVLDKDTVARANKAFAEYKGGANFADLAKKYSDDQTTKNNGGEFSGLVDRTNRDLSAKTTATLFKLKPGEVSAVVNTGYSLEIIKNFEVKDGKVRGAHIVFNFKDINTYLDDLKDSQHTRLFIKI